MLKTLVVTLTFALSLALLETAALAQVDRATLTGIVRDPSGAVVARAEIAVTHLATGVESHATTTSEGTYLIVNLASVEYLVEAQAASRSSRRPCCSISASARRSISRSASVG